MDPTLASYEKIISDSAYIQAIRVFCMRMLVGTSVSFEIIVTMAYPFSKSAKTFRFRNVYMWAVISTMLFSRGLYPLVHDGVSPGADQQLLVADSALCGAGVQRDFGDELHERTAKICGGFGGVGRCEALDYPFTYRDAHV